MLSFELLHEISWKVDGAYGVFLPRAWRAFATAWPPEQQSYKRMLNSRNALYGQAIHKGCTLGSRLWGRISGTWRACLLPASGPH